MSIVFETSYGCYISHLEFIQNMYKQFSQLTMIDSLFSVKSSFLRDSQVKNALDEGVAVYRSRKRKLKSRETYSEEVLAVMKNYKEIFKIGQENGVFTGNPTAEEALANNICAREAARKCFSTFKYEGTKISCANSNDFFVIKTIDGKEYVIPPKSAFHCQKIEDISLHLKNLKFDFILIDPPWWNKFIRRKRFKRPEMSYNMMFNEEIEKIPIKMLMEENGLIAVWATNAPSHLKFIRDTLFPGWGIQYVSTWFWVKLTTYGELVCPFSAPEGKQPYERIIFGSQRSRQLLSPEENKCLFSVPSALHSHKPPLSDVLKRYLPDNSKNLELFARYLLKDWTSYGDEVLALQLLSFFDSG